MNFEFNGNTYRIVFKHDPNRLLSAHIGHACEVRKDKEKNRTITVCLKCRIVIGTDAPYGTLPKALRVRKTWCVIQVRRPDSDFQSGTAIAKLNRFRDVVYGMGKPNVYEGDRFNLKAGRVHSLQSALKAESLQPEHVWSTIWPGMQAHGVTAGAPEFAAFRKAAWTAFEMRGKPAPKLEDYTVKITTGPGFEILPRAVEYREGDNLTDGGAI